MQLVGIQIYRIIIFAPTCFGLHKPSSGNYNLCLRKIIFVVPVYMSLEMLSVSRPHTCGHDTENCSTFKILHDLSSDRREPSWFLSINSFYTLAREDRVFEIILFNMIVINIIAILADKCIGFRIY